MKKIILYIIILLAALGCQRKSEYNQTLGLLSKYNVLGSGGGSTQVAVFSNTDWTVELDHPVSWASVDRFSGHKTGYLVFDYEVNYGRARRVNLVFKAGDQTRTLSMYQEAHISDSNCVMELGGASSIAADAEGITASIPFNTNLVYNLDEMFLTLTYPEGEEPETPWITLLEVTDEKVDIEVAPNTTGAIRTANLRISHTDAGSYNSTEGDTINSNAITIVQLQ